MKRKDKIMKQSAFCRK